MEASRCSRGITSLPRCIGKAARHSRHDLDPRSRSILVETEWSFTLPTRQAPIQPARPTACSLQVKTLRAVGAIENGGLALFSSASGSTWQPPPDRHNHIPKKGTPCAPFPLIIPRKIRDPLLMKNPRPNMAEIRDPAHPENPMPSNQPDPKAIVRPDDVR